MDCYSASCSRKRHHNKRRVDEKRQVFLSDIRVIELPMNLLIHTGSHVSILSETAFRDLDDSRNVRLLEG